MEDYLSWFDYLYAFIHSLKTPFKIKKIQPWTTFDVKQLVSNEIRTEVGSAGLLINILRFRGCKKLKEKGVKIKLVIDWFENQSIDRAFILGIKENYPNINIKGYMGYIAPETQLCQIPTSYEVMKGFIPHTLCVIGNKYIERQQKYCSQLHIETAPAFRFSHLYELIPKKEFSKTICIALPIKLDESLEILQLCKDTALKYSNEFDFIVKFHPTNTKEKYRKLIPQNLLSCFHLTESLIPELLSSSSGMISTASSVCIEAAMHGIPVAIIGSRQVPINNPMENIIPKNRWSVCYETDEITRFVGGLKTFPPLKKEDYFEPVTQSSIDKLSELG